MIEIYTRVNTSVDINKMKDVPIDKIEHVLGQIIIRFSRWDCDSLEITNDGPNNLVCIFRKNENIKIVMGAIWRTENNEFTFHT